MKSKVGLIAAAVYVVVALYLLITQGLFGESFIALILGAPWTFLFAFFEFWNASGAALTLLLILPMVLNAYILYCLGNRMGGTRSS